ncbi:hypothetical protein KC333_g7315 [Hortaea werneckii]|nr:hypothetical protein KC333_g7315 [Hortaea werneckii]KAI7309971.1 hypothetical protein KC326_g6853 [Hortaea werneckii]
MNEMETWASVPGLPIPRRAHKKSKAGCRACKARKVKCDERRPLCLNCERHFMNISFCDFDEKEVTLRPKSNVASRQREIAFPESSGLSNKRDAISSRIPKAVAPGRPDPFDARAESQAPDYTVDSLMHHYLNNFAARCFPFYATRQLVTMWWHFVRADDLLFHVVLLVSGLDQDALRKTGQSIETRQMLDRCLNLLGAQIRDPIASTTDHTLVAIASLAAVEHGRADMRALQSHLAGLKNLIKMRGGLEAIRSSSPLAANVIYWYTVVSIGEPQLLDISFGDFNRPLHWQSSDSHAKVLTHNAAWTDLRDYGVDTEVTLLLSKVQGYSIGYMAALDHGSSQEAVQLLSRLCSIIDELLQQGTPQGSDIREPGLAQSCRIASCLHLFTPMSGYFPDPTLMLHALVRDLKASLTRLLHAKSSRLHLLLWLLSVGGVTAHSMPERSWFVGHLSVIVTDLNIRTWEDMRAHLVALALHDQFCDTNSLALWQEVVQKLDMTTHDP